MIIQIIWRQDEYIVTFNLVTDSHLAVAQRWNDQR